MPDLTAIASGTRTPPDQPPQLGGGSADDALYTATRLGADLVLATIAEGIIVISPDWKIRFVNRVAEEILGSTAATLLGHDYWQAFPMVVGTEMEQTYRRAMTDKQPADVEYFSKVRGRWFHLKAHPSDLGVTICFNDITAFKRSQAEHQVTEDRFRLAASNPHLTLYEQDRSLRYTWLYPLHPEHQHALGRTEAELHPDGAAGHLTTLKQSVIASGREIRREIDAQLPTGTRYYDLFVSPRRNEAGEVIGVAGAALDITERKQFEQALRESEERLRTTYEHAPVGIAETDLAGVVVAANSFFCQLVGFTREELIGTAIMDLTHADDVALSRENFQQLVTGRCSHYSCEKRYQRKDGRTVWVWLTASIVCDSTGKPRSCHGIVLDITDRKARAVEQQLLYQLTASVNRAADEKEIYEAALDALCASQGCARAAILRYDNEQVMRFVASRGVSPGYQRAVEGHSPWRPDDPSPHPVCIGDVGAAELDPELRDALEAEGIRAVAFIPLAFEQRLLGKLMVYYDEPHAFVAEQLQTAETITRQVGFAIARRQAAAALESLVASRTASLQHAVEQMEEFSYTVSHDLRAPVRSMLTFTEAIAEDHGHELSATVKEYFGRIQRSARRMDALVRDTLAYSRVARDDFPLTAVSLDEVVRDVVASVEPRAARAAITVSAQLGRVIGNELSLAQAISNLLNNSLKFSRPETAPAVEIRTSRCGDRLRLLVSDNGIGVPPHLQPRLFRMFERLHPQANYEGTGIGLAIVRKAAERMHGTVGVNSDGLNGSTFWIELAAAKD